MQAIQSRLAVWVLLLPVFLLAAEGERYWERFPEADSRGAVTSVGVDAHDGLWVMAFGICYYWNATQRAWEAPVLPSETPERFWTCVDLFGTPETGLYFLQERAMGNTVHVSRLLDGKVEGVTTFTGRSRSGQINFWPCLGGRLLHWDADGLDVYAGRSWRRFQTKWPNHALRVLDCGGSVSLCTPPRLCAVDARGETMVMDMPTETLASDQRMIVVWGKDRAVAAREGHPGLSAFMVGTGASVDISRANQILADCPVHELVAASDGSVLIWTNRPGESLRLFYRLMPNGEIHPIPDTLGLGWTSRLLQKCPRSVLADPQGQVWFADEKFGVFCVNGDRVRQFEPDNDRSPAQATALALERSGVLYVIGDGGLYAYNQGTSLTGQSRLVPLDRAVLGKPVWQVPVVDGVAAKACRYGDHALVGVEISLGKSWGTEVVDLASGHGCFSLAQTTADYGKGVCMDRKSSRVLLPQGGYAYVVSLATGQVLRKLAVEDAIRQDADQDVISRVSAWRPLACLPGERYVFSHFGGLICLDASGDTAWRHALLYCYPMSPPLIARNQLILQTMGGDLTRSLTCALDLDTGIPTWSQVTQRSGSGMALGGDRRCFVEANGSAGVTCRRVTDGESVWCYARRGAAALSQPVLDPAGQRVYAHFDDAVVCLGMADGQKVWEVALPSVASLPPWFKPTHGRGCLSLAQGVLLLTDGQEVLHLLDPATGAQLARFPLADEVSHHGNRSSRVKLAGAPWMVGDHLVVPLATGLRSYRLPLAAYLPPGRRPAVAWAASPAEQPDTAELALPLATTTGSGKLTVQYQIDDQEWHNEPLVSPVHSVALAGLMAGRHRLRLAVFDGDGRASAELAHGFELKADQAPLTPMVGPTAVAVRPPPPEILLALPPSVSTPPVDASRYWERFPLPPGGYPTISSIAVDEEDRVWVKAGQRLFRWDAEAGEWVDSGLRLKGSGGRDNALCGDSRTGVYVAQFPSGWQGEGQLLRLTSGEPQPVATIPQGGTWVIPSRGGCVAALSNQALRVLSGKDWQDRPFSQIAISLQATQVGDTLWVRHDNELILVGPRGKTKQYRIGDLPMPGSIPPVPARINWRYSRFAPWGKDRAILATSSLWVVDLRSDEPEVSVALMAALGGKTVRDLQTLADGSVLAIADDRRLGRSLFCRIAVDGDVQALAHGVALPPNVAPFRDTPGCVVEDAVGGIWVALPHAGVLRLGVGAQAQWFFPDEDGSPAAPCGLATDSQGAIYAISEGFLYVYNQGASLTGQASPVTRRVLPLGERLWEVQMPEHGARHGITRVGDVALFRRQEVGCKGEFCAVDLASGEVRFHVPLSVEDGEWFSCGVSNRERELTVRRALCLEVLDARTGETVRSLDWLGLAKDDIHPFALGENRLFVSRHDPPSQLCFDDQGKKVWQFEGRSFTRLASVPAVQGNLAVFQTKPPSGHSVTTSLVELDSGRVLWSEEGFNGARWVAFLAENEPIVELVSTGAKGIPWPMWLVSRDVRSGQVRWSSELPGRICHEPIVHPPTRRVYVCLADGRVGCIDGDTGEPLWWVALPHPPIEAEGMQRLVLPSALALGEGTVLVTDSQAILTVLDMGTGEKLGVFRLTEDIVSRGIRAGRENLQAAPWLQAGRLVVPSERSLSAYRFPPPGCVSPTAPLVLEWAVPPPERLDGEGISFALAGTGESLMMKHRLDDGPWQQEPFPTPVWNIRLDGLANRRHRVQFVLSAPDGRWSNELIHWFGEGDKPPALVASLVVAEKPTEEQNASLGLPTVRHWPSPVRAEREQDRYWERFPSPTRAVGLVSQVGIDAGNGIWIRSANRCYSWDRKAREWSELALESQHVWGNFFGGGEVGLYVFRGEKNGTICEILRLEEGGAMPIASFPHNGGTVYPPGTYVARDGRLFVWSSQVLRLYSAGKSEEWEARMGNNVAVFEQDGVVALYADRILYAFDGDNQVRKVAVESSVEAFPTTWGLLGEDRALLCRVSMNPGWGLQGFHLASGKSLDVSPIKGSVPAQIQRLFSGPGGSVLAMARGKGINSRLLYRIGQDNATGEVVAARDFPFVYFEKAPPYAIPLLESSGRVWFASWVEGVAYLEHGQFRKFDYRSDGSPFQAESFALDADGVLYVAGDHHLYAYNQGEPVTGALRLQPRSGKYLDVECWVYELPHNITLHYGRRFGDIAMIWAVEDKKPRLMLLDLAKDSSVITPFPDGTENCRPRLGAGRHPGELAMSVNGQLIFLNIKNMNTIHSEPLGNEYRDSAAPLVLPDHRLLWSVRSGGTLDCRKYNGELIWQFSGREGGSESLASHQVSGDRLIVHGSAMDGVEGSVYALALENGEILWRSPARSRVVGSLATDDGKYALAVRSDGRLDQTGHWLGCWTVRTGRMVWEYSRPDTFLNQIPVYDHATRRVVAYFDDGTIVGLDVHSGELLWERRLYQGPLALPAFHWQPHCYDSLQQIPGMVLASDRTGDVTVLSASTGEVLACYQAAERIVKGVRTGRRSLVAKPWQIGSQLVVCAGTEICSYRFPLEELQRAAAACRPTVESIDYERRIPEWIEQLGAPVAADRMAARKLLLRAGEIAFEELQTRRDDPDPEIREQVREILEALE